MDRQGLKAVCQLSAIGFQLAVEQKLKDFHDLKIWQRSHRLTLAVYRATKAFPKDERYGLTSQMRRCSASNIAKGCERNGDTELTRFLQMALGSASEREYHLLLAFDFKLLGGTDFNLLSKEIVEVKRMLGGFINKLRAES